MFQPLPGWKPAASRQLKLAVLSACIDLWLRELKEASFTGVDIADPWGVMQRVYVMDGWMDGSHWASKARMCTHLCVWAGLGGGGRGFQWIVSYHAAFGMHTSAAVSLQFTHLTHCGVHPSPACSGAFQLSWYIQAPRLAGAAVGVRPAGGMPSAAIPAALGQAWPCGSTWAAITTTTQRANRAIHSSRGIR